MHLQSENNITAIRLGRVLKANVDETGQDSHARSRPLLVTTSNSRFLNSCFARSQYLQNYPTPVYVKKLLSQDDRRLEKELLAKRYEMVTTEGKDEKDFRIKNLKLYYNNELVEIYTQWLGPRKCLLVNCQSIWTFEKRYALTKLCNVNSVTLVFLTETWLYSEITNPETFLRYSFNIIARHDRDRGKNLVAVWLHSVQRTPWMYWTFLFLHWILPFLVSFSVIHHPSSFSSTILFLHQRTLLASNSWWSDLMLTSVSFKQYYGSSLAAQILKSIYWVIFTSPPLIGTHILPQLRLKVNSLTL